MTLLAAGRIVALAAALALYLPCHLIALAATGRSPWPRRFLAVAARICGARTAIIGGPLPRDVLFVANHQSWLDIPVMGAATGTAFVSKAEVAAWPVIGWLARQNHTIFVARADRAAVRAQAEALADGLRGGRPLTLFPEGTTGDGRRLLPFRAALFAAVVPPPPGVRVQPVRIDYGGAEADFAWVGEERARTNALRLLGRRGRMTATLTFLDPIDPAAAADRKTLAAAARRALEGSMPDGAGCRDPADAQRRRLR